MYLVRDEVTGKWSVIREILHGSLRVVVSTPVVDRR